MALQGTLDTFALADLVRLVATTTKTGELAIEGDGDGGSGRLRFVDGDLVGGEPAGPGGAEDALFALLRLDGGTFSFAPDVAPADAGDDAPAQDALEVLARAEARLEAWRPIEALVPHPDVAVRLRPELPGDEVTLDRDVWHQLVTIAGGATARAFAAALDLDEVAAATALKDLADQGLVEVDADGIAVPEPDTDGDEIEAVVSSDGWDEDVAPELTEADEDAFDLDRSSFEEPGEEIEAAAADTAFPADAPEPGTPTTAGWGMGWDVDPVPGDPVAPVLPADAGGSLAVDLDSHLGGATDHHRYLGGEASALPEALPETSFPPAPGPDATDDDVAPVAEAPSEDDMETVAAEAATVPPSEPAVGGADDDLALQLEALSPAAARAVAAAAASSDEDTDDGDAGRRVLRRIISSGRG